MSEFWKRFAVDFYNAVRLDNIFNAAAALAFYLMLAIFPGAIFLLSLLPYLPVPNLDKNIMDLLSQALPSEATSLFIGVVNSVMSTRSGGLLSFGFLFTLWSASSGLYSMMQQLNTTYGIKETRPFWKLRGTAMALLFLFLVFIVGAFGLVVFGGVIERLAASFLGQSEELLLFFALLRWIVIVFFVLTGFAVIYYFGPDRKQNFRLFSLGNITGSLLLIVASLGFNFYVSRFANYSATYGSLGAVIILLLWFYIAGLALLLGSEINCMVETYRRERHGKKLQTKEGRNPQAPPVGGPGNRAGA
jgi:membrane protein